MFRSLQEPAQAVIPERCSRFATEAFVVPGGARASHATITTRGHPLQVHNGLPCVFIGFLASR